VTRPVDFTHARRYRKVTPVAAERLDDDRTWTSGGGDRLRGAAGDWLLSDGDGEWTVADDIFRATYEQQADGRWIKTATILAVQVDEPTDVDTLEGPATARAGDWIAENPSGERWPITAEYFAANYAEAPPPD